MSMIENFEKMLDSGQDSPLLRFSLGNEYLKAGDPEMAIKHLRSAIEQDETYSAAWKALGSALGESGRTDEAVETFERGIAIAEDGGDKQAAKEMRVFLKRLQKQ